MYTVFFIFIGGALGAIIRELLMINVPSLSDSFPMDIFVANILAAFLLGITAALFQHKRINQYANAFIATGVMGGLSTFSSFIYGSLEIMQHPNKLWVGICYIAISLIIGFIAVMLGLWLGNKLTLKKNNSTLN